MTLSLPIDDVLPELRQAMRGGGLAVLQAPPGAGKTTRVPLALLPDIADGRIVMLEPRRLAARAAAERMAETLGEPVGQTVGFRMRGAAKTSDRTRIEVVTEGILTRRLQSDPELPDVACVIFDEIHERSLNADLGLALCLDVRDTLRPDLKLLAMSATLDTDIFASLMGGAPVVTASGRAYPVETRYLPSPVRSGVRLEAAVADLVLTALDESPGSALVFLPGEAEIRRTAALLSDQVPADVVVRPLFGAMPFSEQRAAIEPVKTGRKIVLATAIAETSLTIEDVRIVVDAGRARRARLDPSSGMSRLVTERVTRAEADQRRGRAGRVAEGVCYRLWTRGEEGALAQFPPAEIEAADLAGFALEVANWGSVPAQMALPTQPPDRALAGARRLLAMLGALDPDGRITDHGRTLARMPVHPRLAHMLATFGKPAASLAAALSERDLDRTAGVDLMARLDILDGRRAAPDAGARDRVRAEARRLAALGLKDAAPHDPAEMAALAYPDRIGLRRAGDAPRWILSGGKGARMDPSDKLSGARLIVATDLDGDATEARVRQAIGISEAQLRGLFAGQMETEQVCRWSRRNRRVEARVQERFGALVLSDRNWSDAPPDMRSAAALEGVRHLGLSALKITDGFRRLLARVALIRAGDLEFPDTEEAALLSDADAWLLPYLTEVRSAADLAELDPTEPFKAWLGWDRLALLDQKAPPGFRTPLGRTLAIDYANKSPAISARLQEFFGVTRHPAVAGQPLKITLLSPAGRPVAVTSDLPGFWAGSYADVRKDMRGRYPKHPWPEDPTKADPTLKAKSRR